MKLTSYIFRGFLLSLPFAWFVIIPYLGAAKILYSEKTGVYSKRLRISDLNIYAFNKKALLILLAQSKCEEPTLSIELAFYLKKGDRIVYTANDITCKKNLDISFRDSELGIPTLEKIGAIEVVSSIPLSTHEIRWYKSTL